MPTMREDEYYRMYQVAPQLWWYQSLRHFLKQVSQKFLPTSATLLDAGCGTGENMVYLQQLGFDIQGIDISKTALKLARKRGLKSIRHGSVLEIPFAKNRFDCVYSTDVLVMLSAKESSLAVKEFQRVLKKGGVAIIQCAALEYLRSSHDTVVKAKHRYTLKEMLQDLPQKEWEILIASYRFFWIFPLIALVKYIKKRQPESEHGEDSDVKPIPEWINKIFYLAQAIEDFFIIRYRLRLPWGSSIVVVARKR